MLLSFLKLHWLNCCPDKFKALQTPTISQSKRTKLKMALGAELGNMAHDGSP